MLLFLARFLMYLHINKNWVFLLLVHIISFVFLFSCTEFEIFRVLLCHRMFQNLLFDFIRTYKEMRLNKNLQWKSIQGLTTHIIANIYLDRMKIIGNFLSE